MEISHRAVMVYKSLSYCAHDYLSSKFILHSDIFNCYKLTDFENKLAVPLPRTNNTIEIASATVGGCSDVRQAKSLTSFRKLITSNLNTAFIENKP